MRERDVVDSLRALLAEGRAADHLLELRVALRSVTPGNAHANKLSRDEREALRRALAAYAWGEAMPSLRDRDRVAAKALENLLGAFDVIPEDAEPPPPAARLPATSPAETLQLARYTLGARQLVIRAQERADKLRHQQMTELHVLTVCFDEPSIEAAFVQVGSDPARARRALEEEMAALRKSGSPSFLSRGAIALLKRAEMRAGERDVTILDLLLAALADPPPTPLAQLDDKGLSSAEVMAIRRVVRAGDLGRIRDLPQARAPEPTN